MELSYAAWSLAFAAVSIVLYLLLMTIRKHEHGEEQPTEKLIPYAFLLYIAIAYAQDLGLMWLAGVALIAFVIATILRRVIPSFGAESMLSVGDGEVEHISDEMPQFELWIVSTTRTQPLGEVIGGTALSIAQIVSWVAFADLVILVALGLVENVLPYYIGMVI